MRSTKEIQPPDARYSRWLSIRMAENEATVWSVENVTVFAQRVLGDWMLARGTAEDLIVGIESRKIGWIPLHLEWKRWALEHQAKEIRFWPTFPDKPIVVKTRIPVIVPPNTSVNLYINLPIWLEISVIQNGEVYTLDTIAPTTLTNTWYGDLFDGQLCYALRSRARRSLDDLSEEPLRGVCLLKIKNRSPDSLPVEKIRIHPDHLNLYRSKNRLWTNAIEATFSGAQEQIELKYETEAPSALQKPELIREANISLRKDSIIDKLFFKRSEDG